MSDIKTVIKLGGSLLDHPDFGEVISRWWARHDRDLGTALIFVGGGELVEHLRRYDRAYQLGEELSHRCALAMLDITAECCAKALRLPMCDWPLQDQSANDPCEDDRFVFRPGAWLAKNESQPQPPWPRTWETTSDSLAAVLCRQLHCENLVLLKSCDPPTSTGELTRDIQQWADQGIVDPYFPTAAEGLRSIRIECPLQ